MTTTTKPTAERGSQFWLQKCIVDHRAELDRAISNACGLSEDLAWRSPLPPNFKEFRDRAFLKELDLADHEDALKKFWPKGGPQWDGLTLAGDTRILVEAKAHVAELLSDCKAVPASEKHIRQSLDAVASKIKAKPHMDWSRGLYQMANRVAHLSFLQEQAKIDTYLVFLCFTNDPTHIPTSHDEFAGALKLAESLLGLRRHRLQRFIKHVFIDVRDLSD